MNTQTPLTISKEIQEIAKNVCNKHKPFFIAITPVKQAEPMNCFENVKSQIQDLGGSAVYGWCIYVWPRVFVEFEFHSLWRSNTGELLDISPRHDKELDCLFLQDDSLEYIGLRLPNVRFSLSDSPLVKRYIKAADEYSSIISKGQVPYSGAVSINKDEFQKAQANLSYAQAELENTWQPQRNDPCPCGSRLKYKNCHSKV